MTDPNDNPMAISVDEAMANVIAVKDTVERVREQFQKMGKVDYDRLVAGVTEKLMGDVTFYETLAAAVIKAAGKRKPLPDKIMGVDEKHVLIQDPDPEDERLSIEDQVFTQAGFQPFEGWTHYVKITVGLDDNNSLAVNGGTVYYADATEQLNPESRQGRCLVEALNASMRSLIETGKASIADFKDGKDAWFNMYQEFYSQVTEIEI